MQTGRRHLILARHGDYNSAIEFPANPDGHLNELGRKQAEALADRLQHLTLEAIHTSSLIRARETTEIIAARHPNVPVHVDDALQECIPPIPKGLEALFTAIPADFIAAGPAKAAHAFAAYFTPIPEEAPNRTEVVVSHGNLLGYLICQVFGAPVDAWLRADFGNCCISEVRIRPDGLMKLLYHNDGSHLPPDLTA